MYWWFLITSVALWNLNRLSIHLSNVNDEITMNDLNTHFENINDEDDEEVIDNNEDISTKIVKKNKKKRKRKKKKSHVQNFQQTNLKTPDLDNPMMEMVLNNPEMVMKLMPDSQEKRQFQNMLKVPMFKEMLKDKNTLQQIMKLNKNV
jgi:hypothetical protein|tara:strand:- start:29 stop:472 length:444 start_codon:yes stop_codon:yes gene_type:complete